MIRFLLVRHKPLFKLRTTEQRMSVEQGDDKDREQVIRDTCARKDYSQSRATKELLTGYSNTTVLLIVIV